MRRLLDQRPRIRFDGGQAHETLARPVVQKEEKRGRVGRAYSSSSDRSCRLAAPSRSRRRRSPICDGPPKTKEGRFAVVPSERTFPVDRPAATISYDVDSRRPILITVHFTPSLNLMRAGAWGGQENSPQVRGDAPTHRSRNQRHHCT
jgi:hypothetical protein